MRKFPGMDPYLESPAYWPDFHATFVNYWREALAERLPDAYEARIDERVNLVEVPANGIKRIRPDVAVSRRQGPAADGLESQGVATLEPVTVPLLIEEESRETYIEILHRPERTLVAVLELLSPSNKQGTGRTQYLSKRNALLMQDVHLFELDLLLGGERLPLSREYPPGDYYALISRAELRPNCQVYAWTMQRPLPRLPVPLKSPDADIQIDLGSVFATAYERGRYARSIDYDAPPPAARHGEPA